MVFEVKCIRGFRQDNNVSLENKKNISLIVIQLMIKKNRLVYHITLFYLLPIIDYNNCFRLELTSINGTLGF